jgi:hypothetical protein
MDFLVEAMDTWYAERSRQIQQFGTDYERWTIPPHELELAVMAGASGGGITAALAAAALSEKFDHVKNQSPQPNEPVNTLFQSWVQDIDLAGLVGHADLDANGGKAVSIPDSTPIHDIASRALRITAPLDERRPPSRRALFRSSWLLNICLGTQANTISAAGGFRNQVLSREKAASASVKRMSRCPPRGLLTTSTNSRPLTWMAARLIIAPSIARDLRWPGFLRHYQTDATPGIPKRLIGPSSVSLRFRPKR